MFSGINWSEVEISEPDGFNWQPKYAVVNLRAKYGNLLNQNYLNWYFQE